MVLETMHVAGVVLLIFRVLPYFGSMFSLSVLYATCLVPAVFKLLLTKPQPHKEHDSRLWLKSLVKIIDLVAIAAQVAGIGVPIAVHAMQYGQYRWLVSHEPKVCNDLST